MADDDDDEVNATEEKSVRRRSKSAHDKPDKNESGTKLKKKPRIHVEVIILSNIKLNSITEVVQGYSYEYH